jgi:DNA-binding protein YbaB
MEDLIKALQIFMKYGNPRYPTHCEHDVLHVAINPELVSIDDMKALEALSFTPDGFDGFSSYRFGSC